MTPPASITEDPAYLVDPEQETTGFEYCEAVVDEEVTEDNEFDVFVQLLAKEIGNHGFTNRAFQLIDKVAANGNFGDLKRLFQTQLRTKNHILPPGLLRDCSQEMYVFFEDETGQQISQLHIPAEEVPRNDSKCLIVNMIKGYFTDDREYDEFVHSSDFRTFREFLATYLLHGEDPLALKSDIFRILNLQEPLDSEPVEYLFRSCQNIETWFTRPLPIRHYDNCGLQIVVTVGRNLSPTGVEITPFKLRAA